MADVCRLCGNEVVPDDKAAGYFPGIGLVCRECVTGLVSAAVERRDEAMAPVPSFALVVGDIVDAESVDTSKTIRWRVIHNKDGEKHDRDFGYVTLESMDEKEIRDIRQDDCRKVKA